MIKLNLACGHERLYGWHNYDKYINLERSLPFIDNYVDIIRISHGLEHINNWNQLLYEIQRVLKPNGKLILILPHFSSPYGSSPYHKTQWSILCLQSFTNNKNLGTIEQEELFKIESIHIKFWWSKWIKVSMRTAYIIENLFRFEQFRVVMRK